MKTEKLKIDKLVSKRLILIPYTIEICRNILVDNFNDITDKGLKKGKSWPDADVIDTLPRIINNLLKVEAPTGFESWMIVKRDTLEIIGDIGFKGFNDDERNADIGYGIITEERRNGYAEEAATTIIGWAFDQYDVKEITAKCLPDNVGSIKLLKKLKFAESKTDDEMLCWSLLNPA